MIRVMDWITYDEMIDFQEIYEEISKPFKLTPDSRLDEIRPYGCEMLNIYFNENYIEIEDALIKELVDNKYVICGDTHQESAIPVFEKNKEINIDITISELLTESTTENKKQENEKTATSTAAQDTGLLDT